MFFNPLLSPSFLGRIGGIENWGTRLSFHIGNQELVGSRVSSWYVDASFAIL